MVDRFLEGGLTSWQIAKFFTSFDRIGENWQINLYFGMNRILGLRFLLLFALLLLDTRRVPHSLFASASTTTPAEGVEEEQSAAQPSKPSAFVPHNDNEAGTKEGGEGAKGSGGNVNQKGAGEEDQEVRQRHSGESSFLCIMCMSLVRARRLDR